MLCPFCRFAKLFEARPAVFIIDGISVCEEHVDTVSGRGFGRDLSALHREQD